MERTEGGFVMINDKYIYRFLRCFNRNNVMIVLSYLSVAVNSFFVGIKTNNDEELKKDLILFGISVLILSIIAVFEDRPGMNNLLMLVFAFILLYGITCILCFMSYYVLILLAVETCILVFVWFLKPILQKMLK